MFPLGQRFGHLVILESTGQRDRGAILWRCRCACGREAMIRADRLASGHSKSCGCMWRSTLLARNNRHGGYGSRLYRIWTMLKTRCNDPNARDFKNFGGRGITLCAEWSDYCSFRAWALAHGYANDLSIALIDRTGNFEPANCRWARSFNYRPPKQHRAGVGTRMSAAVRAGAQHAKHLIEAQNTFDLEHRRLSMPG